MSEPAPVEISVWAVAVGIALMVVVAGFGGWAMGYHAGRSRSLVAADQAESSDDLCSTVTVATLEKARSRLMVANRDLLVALQLLQDNTPKKGK